MKKPILLSINHNKLSDTQGSFEGILLGLKDHNKGKLVLNTKPGIGYVLSMYQPQHLYIIDTEAEIKKDDWYYEEYYQKIWQYKKGMDAVEDLPNCKKIIATTDKSLNLPLINKEFVELYVEKQGKIEEVDVVFSSNIPAMTQAIVTPKESSLRTQAMEWWDSLANWEKTTLMKRYPNIVLSIARSINTLTGREIQEIWEAETQSKESSNVKELANLCAKDFAGSDVSITDVKSFDRGWEYGHKAGVQWQKERSYSREEVEELLKLYDFDGGEYLKQFISKNLTK